MDCDLCGKTGLNTMTLEKHRGSKKCGTVVEHTTLDPDLEAVFIEKDPRMQAKMVRAAFSARGWPNKSHPGTVRDFLKKHKVPIIDTPRHTPAFEVSQYMQKRAEEIING